MNCLKAPAVWLLLSLACCGCARTTDQNAFRFPWQEVPEQIPGVTPPQQRIEELQALPAVSGQQAAELSERLAKEIQQEQDPLVRMNIVRALAEVPDPRAAAVLHAGLEDPDNSVRIACCEAWAKRGGADAVQEMATVLQAESDIDVRMAAARALGDLRDPTAVKPLADSLSDNDPAMQRRAIESLKRVSGKDYGYDIQAWRQYAAGEPVQRAPVSFAERLRQLF